MNFRLLTTLVFILFLSLTTFAQTVLTQQDIYVERNGYQIWNPMSGGLNNPQYSAADLNNDNIMDLVIFDRTGNVLLTFENGGQPNQVDYTLKPEYNANFPEIKDWAMLRDYDCDGIMDLFTYSIVPGVGGITAYRGYFDANNRLAFEMVEDYLKFPSFSGFPINLFVSREDYPALDDLDNDGDMDILSFSLQGGYIEYYENKSADMGFGCDSLIYNLVDDCWGRFYESGISNSIELSPRMDSCSGRSVFVGQKGGVHIGSTLLTLDMDNDSDKEIILGDVSFSDLLLGMNGGNADTAYMTWQDSTFPSYDEPAIVNIFPAAYYLDVNNDGKNDLLSSPNAKNVSTNVEVTWYYENIKNNQYPEFEFQQKDFIADGMIDLGADSNPVFFDHNSDGLLDIVVGSYGRYLAGGTYLSSLFLYENIGTPTNPRYALIDEDYGGLAALQQNAFTPDFGDIDGDGDEDMLVGLEDGEILHLENMDNGNGIASFPVIENGYQGIKVGQYSTPEIVDLNKDGLLDIVIGERNGLITYFQNLGSLTSPNYVEVNDSLGLMDPRSSGFPVGYGAPRVIDENGDYHVYLGTESGTIKKYKVNQDSLYSGSFELVDPNYGAIRQGERVHLDIDDINDDGTPDFIVGNRRGGTAIYSDEFIYTVDVQNISPVDSKFEIRPNPADESLTLVFESNFSSKTNTQVFNALGQQVLDVPLSDNNQLDVSKLAAGIYFLHVISDQTSLGTVKFVKK